MSSQTALLVMDVQRDIVNRLANDSPIMNRLAAAIEGARSAHILVVYVTIRFREGYPEVSRQNRSFSAIASSTRFVESDPGTEIHPDVAPRTGDVVVTKRRVGAFTGSDLEIVLRSQGINMLVLTGIATSGVVLSTLRAAADMDYQLVILSDCCADSDEEVHRVLTTKVFPRQAEVQTAEEWLASL